MSVSAANENCVSENLTGSLVNMSLETNNLSLVVFMGLPASGKSTLANKLARLSSAWHTVIISYDDYVPLSIQAEISESSNHSVSEPDKVNLFKVLRKKFVHCVDAFTRFVKHMSNAQRKGDIDMHVKCLNSELERYELTGQLSNDSLLHKVENAMKEISSIFVDDSKDFKVLVVVDDNNYYHSMRNDFYQVAKQNEVGYCLIYCNAPLKTCIQRNSQRPAESRVPNKSLVEMSLKFEVPDALKNVADMYCIEVSLGDKSEVNLELLRHVLEQSVCSPLKKNEDRTEEIERERRICSENEIHQADLVLRKWISKKINLVTFSNSLSKDTESTKTTGSLRKNLSKELNERKKEILDKLRSGEVKVSYRLDEDIEFQGEIVKLFENLAL